ncbi:hypothetical protein [Symmachiella dynata]|uniref:hypothetical protein n=1 Tax=Symmachiella dynata TaxID=2527995 RepID=UPI0030ED1E04
MTSKFGEKSMNVFPIWLRPLGDLYRVRVDTVEHAKWLLDQLSRSFVFKTAAPLVEAAETSACSFEVPLNPPMSRAKLERLLGAIPEVEMMMGPE